MAEVKNFVTSSAFDSFGKFIVYGEKNGLMEVFIMDQNHSLQKRFEVNAFEFSF